MKTSKLPKNQKIILIIVALVCWWIIFYLFISNPQENKTSRKVTDRTTVLINELEYLNDIPEIDWFEVDDNDIYIGFNSIPDDFEWIINAAAVHGNNVINFGVHVWAVNSNQKGWRPGDGPYIKEVTARYGKIEK